MAKSELQKAIEKQTKENQRMARESKRREVAAAIISDQPVLHGIKIMDQESEKTLEAILQEYDGNENNQVKFTGQYLPSFLHGDTEVQYEKLRMYGMLSEIHSYWGGAELTLTERAKTYFEDKSKVQEIERQDNVLLDNKRYTKHKKHDVFISHASKDKENYVDLLVMDVRRLGIDVFYDRDSISWGDNWKQVILDGTAESEFAIIIISENFFGREWTEKELHEFLGQQNETGQKIILPLLLNVTREQLVEHYPELSEIQYIDSKSVTNEEITILLAKELIKRYK